MVVMSGLENPWDMAFTADGSMFYTEKCKGLSVKTAGGKINALYGMKDTKGYKSAGNDLFCSGQAGMLGVTLDPNFKKKIVRFMYIQHLPSIMDLVVKLTLKNVMETLS
jgi:glucose/arabinose dehydrogenase